MGHLVLEVERMPSYRSVGESWPFSQIWSLLAIKSDLLPCPDQTDPRGCAERNAGKHAQAGRAIRESWILAVQYSMLPCYSWMGSAYFFKNLLYGWYVGPFERSSYSDPIYLGSVYFHSNKCSRTSWNVSLFIVLSPALGGAPEFLKFKPESWNRPTPHQQKME